MNLFFSPHNDDDVLFGSYEIQKRGALVVVVFDGHLQALRGESVTASQRREETNAALRELCVLPALFMGYSDAQPLPETFADAVRGLIERNKPEHVFAPAIEIDGHAQHNAVGAAVHAVYSKTAHYLTYTRTKGKSRGGIEVIPSPEWIVRKHKALACHASQIGVANCREHFVGDLREYLAA